MKRFRPLHDRVLVRRVEAEEKTPGGIIIPDTAKEKPVEGEVLAVGSGARDETDEHSGIDHASSYSDTQMMLSATRTGVKSRKYSGVRSVLRRECPYFGVSAVLQR